MNRRFLTLVPVMGALALGAVACGDDENTAAPAGGSSDAAAQSGSASPKVTLSSPGDGETLGSEFTANADLADFAINAETVGKEPKDGEGHLHFSLDGGKFDSAKYSGANGELAEQLGTDGKYSPSVTEEITYKGIPAGEHTLEVYLAGNDHSDTGAEASVTFTVEGDEAAGTSGPNGEAVTIEDVQNSAGGFTATVALDGVEIDAASVGKKPEDGKGHLHFELDEGKYDRPKYSGANGKLAVQLGTDGKYSPAVEPTITYKNLPKGEHVLKVYVANNDHSENGAVAQQTITVD